MQYIKHDTNGRIQAVFLISKADAEEYQQCLQLDEDSPLTNSDTHYILDGEVTERPTSPVTRTDLTLLDVPEGSILWINGESYEAEGEVELEFPLPGSYRLRVECFPFLDWVDEVVAPVVSGVEP